MKARLTVEIEYPDGFDGQWDVDPSGRQAFHDVVICGLQEVILDEVSMLEHAKRLMENPPGPKELEFIKWLTTKIGIMRSVKVVE